MWKRTTIKWIGIISKNVSQAKIGHTSKEKMYIMLLYWNETVLIESFWFKSVLSKVFCSLNLLFEFPAIVENKLFYCISHM